VVAARGEDTFARSFRNLGRTHVVELSDLEVADIVWAHSLIVSREALRRLSGGERS
jgi:ribosomal protein L4